MITDFTDKDGDYIIRFEEFFGSGWDDDLEKIVKDKIQPASMKKNIIKAGFDFSLIEFNAAKDGIDFIISLDDEGPNHIRVEKPISDTDRQKLKDWALIIATDMKKLQ